jgi:dTDP-glucose pyrophosphorylase
MKNWKKTLITKKFTIKETIKNLNSNPFHICMLIDKKEKLIGTITDGDIRRAILAGHDLESKIEKIYNKNPFKGDERMKLEEIKLKMINNVILHLPVVDKKNRIKNIFSLQNLQKEKIIKSIFFIMAGGKGSRLMPLTKKTPKPLLKVMGKPLIEHIIINAKNRGFNDFLISVNYLENKIKKYLGNGQKLGVKIKYISENKELGTAGSLGLLKTTSKEPIVLSNADILTDLNYDKLLEFHKKIKSDFTIAVTTHEIQNPFAVIKIKGDEMVNIDEKPISSNYVNAGIYVFSPKIIKFVKKNSHLNITDLIKTLKNKKKKICIYHFNEQWIDIGNHSDYQKVKNYNFK